MLKQVKLRRFVDDECCNRVAGGGCLGTGWKADASPNLGGEMDGCLVKQGFRCKFFERAVLPLVLTHKEYAHLLGAYKNMVKYQPDECGIKVFGRMEFDQPVTEHPFWAGDGQVDAVSARACPDCGKPLPPRKRYCPECRETHRKHSFRNHKRRVRANGGCHVHS